MASRSIKCSCGGNLAIAGDVKEHGVRIAFKLSCTNCGKEWRYQQGHFFEEKSQL